MSTYLEIKQLLKEILLIDYDIDESCDLLIPFQTYARRDVDIVLPNDELRKAFDKLQNYSRDKLELSTSKYREVALQWNSPTRSLDDYEPVVDNINGITYDVGLASLDYCMFLLDEIVEKTKVYGRRMYIDLRHKTRMVLRRNRQFDSADNPLDILPELLKAYTLKISTDKEKSINTLRDFASSYEYLLMYKQHLSISEYRDVQSMYYISGSGFSGRWQREMVEAPPQRIYNSEVLEYYTMAMESRDPFTSYISFYHVIEHYFDAVFRKKLTEKIKQRMTHPDFSYKSEERLYELAKFIRKEMNSDDESGKGDEFDSLKYVLMEYVPIEDLKSRIQLLDAEAVEYYNSCFVPFSNSNKTKIAWSDAQGVYTNISKRIYETRNSLVHTKSEQKENQYKPYRHKDELIKEIPLIRAVADLVIIGSSQIL